MKDTNNYKIYTEYDAKSEEAKLSFVKNDKVVDFEELPTSEQDVFRCMVGEIVELIFKDIQDEKQSDMEELPEVDLIETETN